MIGKIIQRVLGNLGSNEKIIERLSQSKPIKDAARITAYTITKANQRAKQAMNEFNKEGGTEKMKQVAKQDIQEGLKIFKETISYDLPQTFKKVLRDLDPRRRR